MKISNFENEVREHFIHILSNEKLPEGERNNCLIKNAAIHIITYNENKQKNIVNIIARTQQTNVGEIYGWITKAKNKEISQFNIVEIKKWEEKYKKKVLPDIYNFYNNDGKIVPSLLAKAVNKIYKFSIIEEGTKKKIYYYTGKVHKEVGETFVESKIQEIGSDAVNNYVVRETKGHVYRSSFLAASIFNKIVKHKICFENGVLNLKTGLVEDFKFKDYHKQIIPYKWNPDAKCPKFLKFLKEILGEKEILTVQEFLGTVLERVFRIKKFLIFIGAPNTGKTTLTKIIEKAFGEDNSSAISIHELNEKFMNAMLEGKLLNIYDDLSGDNIKDISKLKALTGGGPISTQKKHRDPKKNKSYPKIIFNSNTIPKLQKDLVDDAYLDRMTPIFCRVSYTDNPKKDPFIVQKITSDKNEMEGFFQWIWQGYLREKKNNKFSFEYSFETKQDLFLKTSDSVQAFLEMVQKVNDLWISKRDLYWLYSQYVTYYGLSKQTMNVLGKAMLRWNNRTTISFVEDGINEKRKDTNRKNSTTGWLNIGFITNDKEFWQHVKNQDRNYDIPTTCDHAILKALEEFNNFN